MMSESGRVTRETGGTLGSDPGVPRVRGSTGAADWEEHHPTDEGALVASTLTRPRDRKVIAGVCAGLADRFGWNVTVVRALFLLSCLLPGPQFLAYIALWIIMPRRGW